MLKFAYTRIVSPMVALSMCFLRRFQKLREAASFVWSIQPRPLNLLPWVFRQGLIKDLP